MKVTIGEVRAEMEEELRKSLEHVINQKSNYPHPYWILVHSKPRDMRHLTPTAHAGETHIITMSHEPPMMIGTICYKVDNRLGAMWRLWNVPLDIPRDARAECLTENYNSDVNRVILEEAQKLPIVH